MIVFLEDLQICRCTGQTGLVINRRSDLSKIMESWT